jgi:hypothetical protein
MDRPVSDMAAIKHLRLGTGSESEGNEMVHLYPSAKKVQR